MLTTFLQFSVDARASLGIAFGVRSEENAFNAHFPRQSRRCNPRFQLRTLDKGRQPGTKFGQRTIQMLLAITCFMALMRVSSRL